MKSLFKSKTFILAVLQALVGVVVVFQTSYPEIGGIAVAKSVLDIILRLYTYAPVSLDSQEELG